MTECRKKGRKEAKEKGREGGRKEARKRRRREEAKEGERKRKKGRRGGSEGERALLASVVHVARALYMNVTQDVAVGLSCILCTPTLDLLNTMHDSD